MNTKTMRLSRHRPGRSARATSASDAWMTGIPVSHNLLAKTRNRAIFQNGRVEAVGREPVGEEEVRVGVATPLETFCTQLETRVDFFIFSRVTH